MNLKKWTSAITLCAVTLAASALPAFAQDTAIVGDPTTPNLQAAADAMAAAMNQVNGGTESGNNGNSQPPADNNANVTTTDYVSLESPAVIIENQIYLPLRSTFGAMKSEALDVVWKPDGQQKVKLSGNGASYELYLNSTGDGVSLTQGGEQYALANVDGVSYLPLTFFKSIINNIDLGLSGSQILVLQSKDGSDIWQNDSFWTGLSTYTETPDVTLPEPEPEPDPEPELPDITLPEVDDPSTEPEPDPEPSEPSTPDKEPSLDGSLLWPADSHYITSDYGYRIDPVGGVLGDFHLGLDIAGSIGDPVYAAASGTVIRASWFSTYGNCIDIQHSDGFVTRYAHLSAYHVSVGDTVTQGQVIADIGATGNVTGPHLHFETIVNGSTVDPMNYFE